MAENAAPRNSTPVIILLLLLLLVGLIFFALPSLNQQTGTTTQTSEEGQCLNNGQSFDNKQEAIVLAQTAEQYRAAHQPPWKGNYGLGSYTICYKNGSGFRMQSDVFPGTDNEGQLPGPKILRIASNRRWDGCEGS